MENFTPLKSSLLRKFFKGIYLSIFAFLIGTVVHIVFNLFLDVFKIAVGLDLIRNFGPLGFIILSTWILLRKFNVKKGFLIASLTIISFIPFYFLHFVAKGLVPDSAPNWPFYSCFVLFQMYYFIFEVFSGGGKISFYARTLMAVALFLLIARLLVRYFI